jgi:hypothetical protein
MRHEGLRKAIEIPPKTASFTTNIETGAFPKLADSGSQEKHDLRWSVPWKIVEPGTPKCRLSLGPYQNREAGEATTTTVVLVVTACLFGTQNI